MLEDGVLFIGHGIFTGCGETVLPNSQHSVEEWLAILDNPDTKKTYRPSTISKYRYYIEMYNLYRKARADMDIAPGRVLISTKMPAVEREK